MHLTNTWKARLHRWRRPARSGGITVVSVASIVGAAAGFKVFLAPDRPDIAAVAQHVNNQQDQIGGFACDLVVTWLTATTTQRATLARFITLPDPGPTLPTTPAAVVTAPHSVSVIHTGAVGDADLYAATVAVTERPYASAQSTRAFYLVPVSMWEHQPRAVTLPARINGPGPGSDLRTAYRQALAGNSPVYALVRGFIESYLTAVTGLDRYVDAGSGLAPIGGYHSAIVTSLASDRAVPNAPGPGTRIKVMATVVAQTAQFATLTMNYALTVENNGGTWMVAAIDLFPQTAESDPIPVAPPHN
jgi:conjugative transposon protein TcpC